MSQTVAEAERQSRNAKAQMMATLGELQDRLKPKNIATRAVEDARARGEQLMTTTVETAKRNPAIAIGAVALLGALLFRKPLLRAAGRLLGHGATAIDDRHSDSGKNS